MITGETRVGTLLDTHPELVGFLADYHPHFGKLRNRLLRKVMAPRVTVADAARMAGLAPETLLTAIRRAVGDDTPVAAAKVATPGEATDGPRPMTDGATPMPAALGALDEARRIRLDVRGDIARGEEPFARIMAAVKALGHGEALVLRVPFEPVPLYDVLGRRGLAHWTERSAADGWTVWFWHDDGAGPAREAALAPAPAGPLTLDVRDLEPPQPMVLVLERLETLARGETLEVLHDRRPLFLYPQLDARGFAHETDEPAPGLVRIRIRRTEATS
jgi:uncharacterized protein (DUF2249 family)